MADSSSTPDAAAWQTKVHQHISRVAAACGASAVVACEGMRCAFTSEMGFLSVIRRPQMLVERALVELFGWPPEVDTCASEGERAARLIHNPVHVDSSVPACILLAPSPQEADTIDAYEARQTWLERACRALPPLH